MTNSTTDGVNEETVRKWVEELGATTPKGAQLVLDAADLVGKCKLSVADAEFAKIRSLVQKRFGGPSAFSKYLKICKAAWVYADVAILPGGMSQIYALACMSQTLYEKAKADGIVRADISRDEIEIWRKAEDPQQEAKQKPREGTLVFWKSEAGLISVELRFTPGDKRQHAIQNSLRRLSRQLNMDVLEGRQERGKNEHESRPSMNA